ncbi:uncharacterized protein MONOS_2109 [Monocercomonoides exilis]|uniref:uncharacterized protein n=1 Tax=Monocercomonoides exilis TaxID=2049356 RepID=UPI00355978EF|nr:hypothetical protein MONOS_2109 [Monocercomonoides exilis]|eukprot:MONOS_2109.1-p1 / transcript=MONOS_2109.1 / gene=MONOS_2109 / organism=Monocercomonoides_exilis_PA203 / gene_product=unspecified product / transcript_product=unspecified product / location=Mono_scaffold00041:119216-119728(-) / protein_length=138 / sequence_SO=supercontig / SO=protein_coding / is_pseudo=false
MTHLFEWLCQRDQFLQSAQAISSDAVKLSLAIPTLYEELGIQESQEDKQQRITSFEALLSLKAQQEIRNAESQKQSCKQSQQADCKLMQNDSSILSTPIQQDKYLQASEELLSPLIQSDSSITLSPLLPALAKPEGS